MYNNKTPIHKLHGWSAILRLTVGGVLCLILSAAAIAKEETVCLIYSAGQPLHEQFITLLREEVKQFPMNPVMRMLDTSSDQAINMPPDDCQLNISIGTKTSAWAMEHAGQVSLLATLIPRQSYLTLNSEYPVRGATEKRGAIVIDQPLYRQVNLIKLLFPEARTVGALLSKNFTQQQLLNQLLSQHHLKLKSVIIREDQNPIKPLSKLLVSSDVFLSLPDPEIYNRHSISSILLTTYRYRVPLIGFSKAYVHAGALAAVYSSAQQIARQTAKTIASWLTDIEHHSVKLSFPEQFSVATNKQVARSLGIDIPDSSSIAQRLMQLEEGKP